MIRIALALLTYASLVCAQTWDWELVEPLWRNPTGFPGFDEAIPPLADVDGDGYSELIMGEINTTVYAIDTTSGFLRWREIAFFAGAPDFTNIAIWQNLDGDPAQELVTFPYSSEDSVRCWEVDISGENWAWIERPDLLSGRIPHDSVSMTFGAVWGQFDSDPNEECVVVLYRYPQEPRLQLVAFELSQDMEWSIDTIYTLLDFFDVFGMFADDFDNDGDLDIAFRMQVPDATPFVSLMETTPLGLVQHELDWSFNAYGCGNVDSDAALEFLYFVPCNFSSLGPELREFVAFDSLRLDYNLIAMHGQLIGELRHPDGGRFVGYGFQACFSFWEPPPFTYSTVLRYYTPNGWVNEGGLNASTTSASLGDLTGDGFNDILNTYHVSQGGWPPNWVNRWSLLANNALPDRDMFTPLSGVNFVNDSFDFPADYASPKLGDVDGDGNAELFCMLADTSNHDPRRLWIFRVDQLSPDEIILPANDLLTDLPLAVSSFEVADLDGDGLAEIMPVVNGERRIYFFRNGHWETYPDILPDITAPIRGFADWDGDGTTDIFTDEGIYLNLTPSATDEASALVPSSFTLTSYPNPFNAQTTIQFDLPHAGNVSLRLFDLLGREVATLLDKPMIAGSHSLSYDAASLPSGVYFARLASGDYSTTHKLLLLR